MRRRCDGLVANANLRPRRPPRISGLVAPTPSGSADLTPIVSPDRMEDAPTNSRDALANFAWRAFIALNWPSLTDDRGRGEPDREMRARRSRQARMGDVQVRRRAF